MVLFDKNQTDNTRKKPTYFCPDTSIVSMSNLKHDLRKKGSDVHIAKIMTLCNVQIDTLIVSLKKHVESDSNALYVLDT